MTKMVSRIFLVSILLFSRFVTADVLVLNNGKTLQIDTYRVEGTSMVVTLSDRAEMVIPLEWVTEIRAMPKPVAVVQPSVGSVPVGNFAYSEIVLKYSKKHHIDWRLVTAVMKVESNFNPHALSSKGALGLMQLMPDTARLYRVSDPYDPVENIEAGIKHLRMLIERYQGKVELALAAYNSGHKTVDRYRGIPPYHETRQYVTKVLKLYQGFSRRV